MKLAALFAITVVSLFQLRAFADESPPSLEKQIRSAYQSKPAVKLVAKYRFDLKYADKSKSFESELESIFVSPIQFRHEMKNDVCVIAGGDKLVKHDLARNRYWRTDYKSLESGKNPTLPSEINELLRQQNPVLQMLITSDPDHPLGADADDAKPIEGGVSFNRGGAEVRFLIDPQSKIVRQVTLDLADKMKTMGSESIVSAIVQIDYTTTSAEIDAKAFAFAAPVDAVQMGDVVAKGDESNSAKHPSLGKPAPEFSLKGLDDTDVKLGDLKGSVVVLDFWATWCGPCKEGLPFLDKTYQQYKAKGLKAFAVNVSEEKAVVQKFVEKTKLGVPVLLDSDGKTSESFGVQGIPHQVVIGKDGSIKAVFIGFDDQEVASLRAAVEKALAE